MKKSLSVLLALVMIVALLVPAASAAGAYEGKTVVIATGNIAGDVDVYARAAAVKDYYANKGANVLLVDGGNYLQGKAAANADRGLTVYNLMDAAGYTAAAMGTREFYYGDAATGQLWHANYYRYFTQNALYRGSAELTYNVNGSGSMTATRPAKDAAKFSVLASNITVDDGAVEFYAFDSQLAAKVGDMSVGIYAPTDPAVPEKLQDGFTRGLTFAEATDANAKCLEALSDCDITICLNNTGSHQTGATVNVDVDYGAELVFDVYVIDNATKAVTTETLPDVTPKNTVQAIADEAKTTAIAVGTSSVTLSGADRENWREETNLGDLVADALKWYAENKFDGFANDVPVVAIQNGGNCDQYIYDGDVTKTDILRALPFSPMGVGILYITVGDLAEMLEAGTSPSESYGSDLCPGFAQVAGVEYEVHKYKEYQAGEAYGKFYRAEEVNRVVIKSINGKPFDSYKADDVIALIADNYIMNGNDTYYTVKDIRAEADARYLNNGNGVLTRDIVEMYLDKVLKGEIDETYAEPQGRITVYDKDPSHTVTVTNGTADPASAMPGETVTLKADAPAPGEVFDKWTVLEGGVTLAAAASPETTFVMGDADVKVEATYKPAKCDGGASCPSKAFTDVDRSENSWSHEAIDWAVVNEVTNGVDATHFAPGNDCTRAQAVTFLWRAMGNPEPSSTKNPFTDVARDAYYYKAVLWAAEKGITNGVSADKFDPNGTCTRGQIVTFLWRAEGKVAPKAASAFTDVAADAYYADAVAWAVETGVTNGTSPTTFAPDSSCTRAHIVTFLYRDLNK